MMKTKKKKEKKNTRRPFTDSPLQQASGSSTEWTRIRLMARVPVRVAGGVDYSIAGRTVAIPDASLSLSGWQEGDQVLVDFDGLGTLYSASVTKVLGDDSGYEVLYDDGTPQTKVPSDAIHPPVPLEEGATVLVHTETDNSMMRATVQRVRPSGGIDALLDKGQRMTRLGPDEFARQM